jgi:hypothetical protein
MDEQEPPWLHQACDGPPPLLRPATAALTQAGLTNFPLAPPPQFLESYKSVTLDNMADAFDVSAAFLDTEIAELIVAGRLNAKIDKVAGIVETNR